MQKPEMKENFSQRNDSVSDSKNVLSPKAKKSPFTIIEEAKESRLEDS